jgi:Ankyrin repeats (3 copies)
VQINTRIGFPKPWTSAGYLLLCGAALFVGRIVYEETLLTWINGPQMVGFAMMHGGVPFILIAGLIGLLGGLLWVIASGVMLLRKKFRIPLTDWLPLILLPLIAMLLFIPYETWEELTVRIAGPGSHGREFMVEAAANGKRRFFMHLLHQGYDINYEAGGGTTALSGAAVEGNEEMVSLLISLGADVNRKNGLTRETPLMAASEMGKFGAAKVLLKNGADPCATNKDGNTAAGLAKEYGHTGIAEYLSSRFHCQEKVIDWCSDPSVTCVHP